jgi:hypothetical protein
MLMLLRSSKLFHNESTCMPSLMAHIFCGRNIYRHHPSEPLKHISPKEHASHILRGDQFDINSLIPLMSFRFDGYTWGFSPRIHRRCHH